MKRKLKLAVVLFFLGFTGVLSLLWMEFPLPEGTREILSQSFTEWQLRGLILINPTLLLLFGVICGTFLYKRAKLKIPVFRALIFKKKMPSLYPLFIIGLGGGLFAGLLMTLCNIIAQPYLPSEFLRISLDFSPPLLIRILYGGVTEEIIMRFGVMTFLVWLIALIGNTYHAYVYWSAIVISSLVFGILHLPLVFALVPYPPTALISYIVITNAVGGLVFGWLFWKKGLAAAMMAHMITHLVMLGAQL